MNTNLDGQRSKRPLAGLESRAFDPFSAEDITGNVWDRFCRVAESFPDRPVVVSGDQTTTYRELLRLAEGYADRLSATQTEGSPHSPVGLLTDDVLQRIAGMLGALRLGHPFLPLDSTAPSGRLQLMLRDSGAAAVVTDDRSRSSLSLFEGEVIDSPEALPMLERCETTEVATVVATVAAAVDPALILYTSGSTGRPKCVVQQHGMILDSLSCYSQALRISPEDRLSLLASPGFGEAWNDVFLALLNGAALCVREVKIHGLEGLADWLGESEITILHCVPTLLRALVAGLPVGTSAPRLRIVNLGGEAVSRTDVQLCFNRLNNECVVVNSYGSTETKLIAQLFVDRETEFEAETVPVGSAREGVEIRLLGEDGTPVPPGAVGEIEVCSRSVVEGYDAGRAGTEDCFQRDDPSRMRYRTGDLGRFNAQGLLESLGRRDQMVKLRGYRIELSEIESLLQTHPEVQQAVVVVYDAPPQIKQLVAAYQSHDEIEEAEVVFGKILSERLPDYMLPSRYLRLDQFPLTDSGKPDRQRLLELVGLRRKSSNAGPNTPGQRSNLSETPRRLLRIVAEVLQLDDVPLDAGFIELGGDSLNVTQLLIRIAEEFDRTLTAESVFQSKTLLEISREIERSKPSPGGSSAPSNPRQKE